MRSRTLAAVLLCLVLVLAGCSGQSDDGTTTTIDTTTIEPIPTTTDPTTADQSGTLLVDLRSDSDVTVTVTSVAPENDGIEITYGNGGNQTYEGITDPESLPGDALVGATTVEPLVGESSMSYSLSGGSGSGGGAFGWPTEPATVLYSVSGPDGTVLRWGVLDCDGGTVSDITLDVAEGSVSVSHGCAS